MVNIDRDKCIGCGICVKDCVFGEIEMDNGKAKSNNINCNKCGHCIAICPKGAVSIDEYDMGDVKNYNENEFSVNPENLLNLIKFRRSVRQFESREVEEEKIRKIIESGRFTPTATNMQDVSYTVVREGLQELKAIAIETLNEMGKHMLVDLTPETMPFVKKYAEFFMRIHQEYQENPNENDKLFFNAPTAIIVTSRSDWAINGALASSNMELMANALGLGTFFCGLFVKAAEENKKIMELIGVKEGEQIVACMPIGYPNVKYSRTVPRKKVEISWL